MNEVLNFIQPKDAWDKLSLREKAAMMKVAVKNGIYDLPTIRKKYNEFAEGGSKGEEEEVNTNSYSIGNLVNALYQNNPKEKYLGEPEHHYDFTQSEEWANVHGYYPDARGHRDDRVKKPTHPSHPSRGVWDGDKFVLTDFGMQNPNYTLFGLNDGGQDPQATLIYNNSVVFPELTVTPNENYFFNPYDNIELHYAKGGKIHIKPENRGKFTALKERTGHSATWFKEHGTPAQKKMATFALNSRKWKHGLGGNLFAPGGEIGNYYDGWGDFKNFLKRAYGKVKKVLSSDNSKEQDSQLMYRNRPAERVVTNPFEKEGRLVPVRQRSNTSKTTKKNSEALENMMRSYLANKDGSTGSSNPEYDIPFIPEKAILINGSTTSTNVLDSLAKYAGIHNRNPQLSQYPRKKRSSYGAPRKISMNEMLGLSTQETHNGAMPGYNYADSNEDKRKALNIDYKDYNRALGNANYLTAFGYIPAENLVRNFQYNDAHVDRTTPPLLDAFRYFAQGDYNPGDPKHTPMVNEAGRIAWANPEVKKWWELSGKYWYNNGKGPNK